MTGTDRASTTPARISAAERLAIAVRLRREGWGFADIAAHRPDGGPRLYATRQGASRAVNKALRALPVEDALVVRALELERLDALQRALWEPATEGIAVRCDCGAVVARAPSTAAAQTILRGMERRAELLGLDHRHGLEERHLAILQEQVMIAAKALGAALDRAQLDPATRRRILGYFRENVIQSRPANDGA